MGILDWFARRANQRQKGQCRGFHVVGHRLSGQELAAAINDIESNSRLLVGRAMLGTAVWAHVDRIPNALATYPAVEFVVDADVYRVEHEYLSHHTIMKVYGPPDSYVRVSIVRLINWPARGSQ